MVASIREKSTVGHARHDSMPDVAVVESRLQLD